MKEKNEYFYNLDGLRFIAAALVFLCHFSIDFAVTNPFYQSFILPLLSVNGSGGTIAVSFFFVLSGFLITYLLIKEKNILGRINILRFYKKRTLRIWPLYYVIVIIGFFIYPALSKLITYGNQESASFGMYAAFLGNFDQLYFHKYPTLIVSVLWSIAVEEQFYLLWPFIILFMLKYQEKHKRLLILFIILITFSIYYMIMNIHNPEVIRIHTISSLFELGTGGILAYFAFYYRNNICEFYERNKKITKYSVLVYSLGVLGIYLISGASISANYYIVFRLFCALYFAFLIIDQVLNYNAVLQFSHFKILSYLGRISFGIYMYHAIPIAVAKSFSIKFWPVSEVSYLCYLVFTLSITIFLSHYSFKYFESYFLKLK